LNGANRAKPTGIINTILRVAKIVGQVRKYLQQNGGRNGQPKNGWIELSIGIRQKTAQNGARQSQWQCPQPESFNPNQQFVHFLN